MPDYGPKPSRTASGTLVSASSIVNSSSATTSFSTSFFDSHTSIVAVEVQTASSYVTFDGTSASATNGHVLFMNQAYHWSADTLKSATFKAIGASGRIMASQFMIQMGNTQLPDMSIIKQVPI